MTTNYTTYVDRAWGLDTDVTIHEHEAACRRMQDYIDEHEPDDVSIVVDWYPGVGKILGTYRVANNGDEQLLGGSVPLPEDIRELILTAWGHACETWP